MKVTVNGQVFDNNMCMYQLQRISQEKPGISEKDAQKEVADDIVKHVLLKEYAQKEIASVSPKKVDAEFNRLKQNYQSEAEFQKMCQQHRVTEDGIKKDMEESMRINLFVETLGKDVPPAPRKIIEEYYKREHKVSTKPKEIHAAHIVKKVTPATAQKTYSEMCEIRKKLLAGADFTKLADESSSCNDAGGDLGFFPRGKMVEEFDVIAFSMNPGEISPVFQTQFGYHIAKVYELKKEERMSLEECEEEIKQAIKAKMTEECVNKWLGKVKQKAKIQIEK
jgi:parvulin-like peptidyl-prolyl isomerase